MIATIFYWKKLQYPLKIAAMSLITHMQAWPVWRKWPDLWDTENWHFIMTTDDPHLLHILLRLSWPNHIPMLHEVPNSPGCFPSWRKLWRGHDLCHESTLCRMRRSNHTQFPIRFSDNASNNERNTGKSVCSPKRKVIWRG